MGVGNRMNGGQGYDMLAGLKKLWSMSVTLLTTWRHDSQYFEHFGDVHQVLSKVNSDKLYAKI